MKMQITVRGVESEVGFAGGVESTLEMGGRGAKGDTGATGDTGPTGATGDPGVAGNMGPYHQVGAPGEPAFAGSWGKTLGSLLRFFKSAAGIVYLQGSIINSSTETGPTTIFTLPEGFWPEQATFLVAGFQLRIDISTAGVVSFPSTRPAGSFIGFDGLSFRTGGATTEGFAGFAVRGAWNAGTAYVLSDIVGYNGSSYSRLLPGTTPATPDNDTANWFLVAEKGDPGGSRAVVFAFGDASPAVVFTAPSAGVLTEAAILVSQSFDGATPQLSLAKGATSVLSAAQNTPAVAAEYVVSPGLTMAAGDTVSLTIVPGFGATQGQGFTLFAFSTF